LYRENNSLQRRKEHREKSEDKKLRSWEVENLQHPGLATSQLLGFLWSLHSLR